MELRETLGIITATISILGVLVALTRYITQLQFKITQDRLEKEKEDLNNQYLKTKAQYDDARSELTRAKEVGAEILARKLHLDDALTQIMKESDAEAGSIYVPSKRPGYLIFLSIQPLNQQTSKLKITRIPISQSLAGKCFTTGKSFIVSNAKQNPEHYQKADNISGVTTEDTLQLPLRHQGQSIGVLQLMNKEGTAKFAENDIKHIEAVIEEIAQQVFEFMKIDNIDEILGIRPEEDDENATVMFCDLTNSSLLFQELNPSMAIRCINEYLESVSNVAFKYGATVDKYIGDGVIFRFNVPRNLENHLLKAVQSAIEIQDDFENRLRKQWHVLLGERGSIYTRAGISFGKVQQALIGHPQYQYLTILGRPINIAVNLCDVADRSRSIIVVDESVYKQLPSTARTNPLPKDKIGKASSFISSAYELYSL